MSSQHLIAVDKPLQNALNDPPLSMAIHFAVNIVLGILLSQHVGVTWDLTAWLTICVRIVYGSATVWQIRDIKFFFFQTTTAPSLSVGLMTSFDDELLTLRRVVASTLACRPGCYIFDNYSRRGLCSMPWGPLWTKLGTNQFPRKLK